MSSITDPRYVEKQDSKIQDENRPKWIRIPRRPPWSSETSASMLQMKEQEAFLEWRRELAYLEDSKHFIITPFERNLEVWRQLWRVLEACDLIVQIVDARNPLIYYCEDIYKYAKELSDDKKMIVLINKADFLSKMQREAWADYFKTLNLLVYFYSARIVTEKLDNNPDIDEEYLPSLQCDSDIMDRVSLLKLLHTNSKDKKVAMIGYPNVGKSSTINSLAGNKRVAVAATPGKTKHFQTINLDNGVILYDCPGLVTPNFAVSRAELVLNGILPIDQLRDWISPVALLVEKLPRDVIETIYGIRLPIPSSEEVQNRNPTASELLSSFASARGFRTSFHGNPDESRAARIILKDFVAGKLLYCNAPPLFKDSHQFNEETWLKLRLDAPKKLSNVPGVNYSEELDVNLAHVLGSSPGVHLSGMSGTSKFKVPTASNGKKHFKMNKRK